MLHPELCPRFYTPSWAAPRPTRFRERLNEDFSHDLVPRLLSTAKGDNFNTFKIRLSSARPISVTVDDSRALTPRPRINRNILRHDLAGVDVTGATSDRSSMSGVPKDALRKASVPATTPGSDHLNPTVDQSTVLRIAHRRDRHERRYEKND